MQYKVLVVATETWKSRAQKHKRMANLMTAGGALTDVTFTTQLWTKGKPEIKEGKPTEAWFEKHISGPAKAKGYTHAVFSFSMLEGRRWGIDSGVRGSNYRDGDYFGESWVRADEHSIVRFKDGTVRDRYEKVVPHEIGHELKTQKLTTLEIHDYDFEDKINNLEGFYRDLVISSEAEKQTLWGRVRDLTMKVALLQPQLPVKDLQPLVRRKAHEVVIEMEMLGHPVRIVEGYRTMERQQQLYDQGRVFPGTKVTNARPGESYHNYGCAVDYVFIKEGYNASDELWETLGIVMEKHGFSWGGRWVSFKDRPHGEMTLGYKLVDFKNNTINWNKYA